MLTVLLYVIAGWITLGAVTTISLVGKPREPITGGVAAFSVLVQAAIIVTLIFAAVALA